MTSIADILAGIAISGFFMGAVYPDNYLSVIFLCLSTVGLYGGGVAFNDIFDSKLDLVERPERPIPSGVVSLKQATILATLFLLFGISSAFFINIISGLLAISISVTALFYNKWGKHYQFFGPINMGLCRGLNLLLGISIIPVSIFNFWFIALIPIVYISSITMISRGEVHGSKRNPLYFAAFLYITVIAVILYFAWIKETVLPAAVFLAAFSWMIFKPLIKAIKEPIGANIGKAVKAGVISLIIMDASWAAAAGELQIALIIIILLPISLWLSRLFAVT